MTKKLRRNQKQAAIKSRWNKKAEKDAKILHQRTTASGKLCNLTLI